MVIIYFALAVLVCVVCPVLLAGLGDVYMWHAVQQGWSVWRPLHWLNRRTAMLRPLLELNSGELVVNGLDDMSWPIHEPFQGVLKIRLRAQARASVEHRGHPCTDEYVAIEFDLELPRLFGPSLSIKCDPDKQVVWDTLDPKDLSEHAPPLQTLLLCDDTPGYDARQWSAQYDHVLEFINPLSDHHTQGALTVSRAQRPRLRLCHVERSGHRLTVRYVGRFEGDTVRLMLYKDIVAFQESLALLPARVMGLDGELREHAMGVLTDTRFSGEVRRFAAKVALDLYKFRHQDQDMTARIEDLIFAEWSTFVVDEKIVVLLGKAFLERFARDRIVEYSNTFGYESFTRELLNRSSAMELVSDSELEWSTRRDMLINVMRMKRAFARDGATCVAHLTHMEFCRVLDVFLTHGWESLWEEPWMRDFFRTHMVLMDADMHLHMFGMVGTREAQSDALARLAWALAVSLHQELFETEVRGETYWRVLPDRVLAALLKERADLEEDAVYWRALLERVHRDDVPELFRGGRLRASHQFGLLLQIAQHARLSPMLVQHKESRLALLDVLEETSAANSAYTPAEYDRLVRTLCLYDAEIFDVHEERKSLELFLKSYVRQVERQGIRRSALLTLYAVTQGLPDAYKKWADEVTTRWSDQVGPVDVGGGLSAYDDQSAGALSVTERG